MTEELLLFENKVECPFCQGNGLICKVTLHPINKIVYACDECEATWLDPNNIDSKKFIYLRNYVESLGYTYAGITYKDEDYYWYAKKHQLV